MGIIIDTFKPSLNRPQGLFYKYEQPLETHPLLDGNTITFRSISVLGIQTGEVGWEQVSRWAARQPQSL